MRAAARILLVEDDAAISHTLALILEQHGFQVAVAFDGASATDSARQIRPDLLLADVTLPDINGVELARRIATEHPECRIVLMTGELSATVPERSFELLLKPVHPLLLIARLRSCLGLTEVDASLSC